MVVLRLCGGSVSGFYRDCAENTRWVVIGIVDHFTGDNSSQGLRGGRVQALLWAILLPDRSRTPSRVSSPAKTWHRQRQTAQIMAQFFSAINSKVSALSCV